MARRLTNVGSIHQFMGRPFHLEHDFTSIQYHQKTKAERASIRHKSPSWDINWIRFERGREVGLVIFCGGYQEYANNSAFEIHVQRFKSKEVEFLKRTMKMYSHAERAKSHKRNSHYLPLLEKRAATSGETRDPDPDVEVRQRFLEHH